MTSAAFRLGTQLVLLVRRHDVAYRAKAALIERFLERLGEGSRIAGSITEIDTLRAMLLDEQLILVRTHASAGILTHANAPCVPWEGARLIAVPRSRIWDAAAASDAKRLLVSVLADGGLSASIRLRQLADEVSVSFSGEGGAAWAVSTLVDAISMRRIVVVTLRERYPALDAVRVADLRDVYVDGPGNLLRPDDPDPDRPPALTWVSFEVVDDRGAMADGRFRIVIDAKTVGDPLDRRAHRFGELREGAVVRLLVEDPCWPVGSDRPPTDPGAVDPPPVGPVGDGVLSLEIVDTEGHPLFGTAAITWEGGSLPVREITHRVEQRTTAQSPVTVQLAELRPTERA